jgi:hypothetical protein
MMEKTLPNDKFAEFFGVKHWYSHPSTRKVYLSPAVKFIAEQSGCYWLIHQIALAQNIAVISALSFQYWYLDVQKNRNSVLTCSNFDEITIAKKSIKCADFSRDEISLVYADGTIMLINEYWDID